MYKRHNFNFIRDGPIFCTDLQIRTMLFGLFGFSVEKKICTPQKTILFHYFTKLLFHFKSEFFPSSFKYRCNILIVKLSERIKILWINEIP